MLKDLKGLKLGVSTLGAGTDTMLRFLLDQVGIKPSEGQILPVGGPGPQGAGIKNGTLDGAMSYEPAQSEAVKELKIAKMALDLERRPAPELSRDYAYNGLWATGAYLKGHQEQARALVASIVEAQAMINDPAQTDKILKVAIDNMRGIDPELLRFYIETYRQIYRPVGTPTQIEHVETYLKGAGLLKDSVPYDKVVATDIMPKEFTAPAGH